MNDLWLYNFDNSQKFNFSMRDNSWFSMKTCQRSILLGVGSYPDFHPMNDLCQRRDFYKGIDVYIFLLEMICGLKSQMCGETEIVSQFKEAYRGYLENFYRSSKLIRILEKLLQDNKKIRSEHLRGLKVKTYPSVAQSLINKFHPNESDILVLGSGKLGTELIGQLSKKYSLTVTSRNDEKSKLVSNRFDCNHLAWSHRTSFVSYSVVLSAISTDNILFSKKDLLNWYKNQSRPLFLDFGHCTCVDPSFSEEEGVYRLNSIFKMSEEISSESKKKIEEAKKAIKHLSYRRNHLINRPEHNKEILISGCI